ncbi:hypothetical protein KKJ09_12640 [Xenorhabdus bovienii]|uniref:hypothetical protein n=2 Tax=Xenorhabdus bovienii TaxID=40576 RepID=UPI0023B24213|nr:hypothetical protein [Xenorhabdus bovienii]MDE9494409.1 hypothetical protein [Xenorhabdus bovienii]MDE9502848.1 hypothetical protein [Xenorhabdus bovienii]MDE9526463.1 hypothetical protein [Xenorhabdus bovienii]MDE9568857.1 hypothetical protein [Xenorhabdus bovienii]
MATLSKSLIASSVASTLSLYASNLEQIQQRLSSVEKLSSAEKKELQAAQTKVKYFTGLSALVTTNEKAVSALYYIVKNAKQDPADLLKEIATNSYSLNKFGFIIKSIADGFYNYDISDMSASNIIAMLDFIKADKIKFSMREYRAAMGEYKKQIDRDIDDGFTQTNQALKLCERMGIVSYTGGKISAGYGEYKINSENELVKYLKSIFVKDKATQKELDLAVTE